MSDYFSGISSLAQFGLASALLSTLAFLPYIKDTYLRRTQPQRASWLIWSVLGSIAFFSQLHEGATQSLWFAGVQVSGTITVFLMSIMLGRGRFLDRGDGLVLALAAFGLLAWYLTDRAAYALAMTITISLLGGIATVAKAWRSPHSETLSTWVLSFFGSGCAVLAVGGTNWILLAYPLYLLTLNGAITAAILLGRARGPAPDLVLCRHRVNDRAIVTPGP